MKSYLSYETEKREIRVVPINVSLDDLESNNTHNLFSRRYYHNFIKISFLDESDAYQFLQFFEIDKVEVDWKYIKHDINIFCEKKFSLKGSSPATIGFDKNWENIKEIEIDYDSITSSSLSEEDKLFLISKERDQKLISLGI